MSLVDVRYLAGGHSRKQTNMRRCIGNQRLAVEHADARRKTDVLRSTEDNGLYCRPDRSFTQEFEGRIEAYYRRRGKEMNVLIKSDRRCIY